MILKKASKQAIKYSCLKYHYSKCMPGSCFGYSIFDKSEFCGVILYGVGACANIGRPYGLNNGQVIELLRVALNGKQYCTSKAVSLSIKLLKKDCPAVKMVVSYADTEQGHNGTIYQATNWIYTGSSSDTYIEIDGIVTHRRSIFSKYGTSSLEALRRKNINVKKIKNKPKLKYIYPLDKSLRNMCKELSKPYPKKASIA